MKSDRIRPVFLILVTIIIQASVAYYSVRASEFALSVFAPSVSQPPAYLESLEFFSLFCFFAIPLVGILVNLFFIKLRLLVIPTLYSFAGFIIFFFLASSAPAIEQLLGYEFLSMVPQRVFPVFGGIVGFIAKLRRMFRYQNEVEGVEVAYPGFRGRFGRPKRAAQETGITERVALPPPRELGELDDDETVTAANWKLEVRKLWGNTVLDVKNFSAQDKQVWVGEKRDKVDFTLPKEMLPRANFPVAQVVGHQVLLSFASDTKGEVSSREGARVDLKSLASTSRVRKSPKVSGCRAFQLEDGEVATLYFGPLGLRFRYVSKPAAYLSKRTDQLDFTYLNTLLFLLFGLGLMISTFHLRPKTVDPAEEELYKVPDRFVQFIMTRPKPTEKDYLQLAKLRERGANKKSATAARHKRKEGKMGKRGKPDTGRRSAVRAIKPDDKKLVGNRGLLAVLGSGGSQGLSAVTGGTGLGGDLEGAIGNMNGQTIGNSGGFGGLGLKGTNTGGGGMGNTIGVGRLGTRGRGGGRSGYGMGVSRIRRRSERNVSISIGKPVIMGSLSMEIIRRVIHSHRDQIKYCYSNELTRNPNLRGRVSIRFTINNRGYVQQATVGQTSLRNASVERCMTRKIRTWKFPEPQGGGVVIVNYPFILSPQ